MTADEIVAARTQGLLLADARSLPLDEGYALAGEVWAQLAPHGGWKIGATSLTGQAMFGIDAPIVGRVPEAGVTSPGTLTIPGNRDAEAEPEIVFRVGDDGGIAAVHLGIEIVRPSRDDAFDLGPGYVVADNAAHVALVVGPEIDVGLLDAPETLTVSLSRNGETLGSGNAAAVLGDPRNALRWLKSVYDVRPGEWVASGAMARACRCARGDTVVADFGDAGRIEIVRA